MKIKIDYLKDLFLLIISIFFATCANQLPPGGGEVDKIPPEIIEIYPEDGTTNFNENYFEIGFSEYVDKRSVQDAIFISPAIEGEIEYDWSGKYLRVYFPEDLKINSTYVITIGTDVVDYNNRNRMAEALTFTFSTGNEIDRRMVTGKIYDPKSEDVMIFAYKMSDTTANPLAYKPDYISQAGNKGNYKLMGLASGKYRIFAVQDEYRDLLFQPEQDRIGIPFTDITLAPEDTLYTGLDFFISSADTTAPRLISAVMTDKFHVLINLTEEFDSTIIIAENFSFIDSTSEKKIDPLYAFKGNTKPTEFVLVVPADFPNSEQLYIIADSLKDREGNIYSNDITLVTPSANPDTTKPKIFKTDPSPGSREVDYQKQDFFFFFDDAFDRESAATGITFSDTSGKKVQYSLMFIDDASFKISLSQRLEPQKDYLIKIDLSKFGDAAGNRFDSVYQYIFKTISGLDFTGVSGIIPNANFSKNPIILLESRDKNGETYKKSLKDRDFTFERIEAGKYSLWCFYDIDSSNTYSYGSLDPFNHSEEFFFYADTLKLKARWKITDINFLLKER